MQFSTALIASVSILATTASAAPGFPGKPSWSSWWPFPNSPATCLPATVAADLVTGFGGLLSNFTAADAINLLSASNFTDTSDSINFLAGIPLGSATFPNQTAFIYGQGAQPAIGFDLLAIDAATCEGVIAFRWQAAVGLRKYAAKGITVLYTSLVSDGDVKQAGLGGWQINDVFSEFNSAAWIDDIGGTVTLPSF